MKLNKLIAEFMGLTNHHNDSSIMVAKTPQGNEILPIDSLQYDTSWDWLMPVVAKINLLDDYRYTVYIASMDTKIVDNITGNVIVDINCKHSVDELIQSVYEAVVGFIKNQKD